MDYKDLSSKFTKILNSIETSRLYKYTKSTEMNTNTVNNKFKIIDISDYILAISDEEILPKDLIESNDAIYKCTTVNENEVIVYEKNKYAGSLNPEDCKKIIAYQPKNNALELDLPLLPEIVVEDDVEKLAEKIVEEAFGEKGMDDAKELCRDFWIDGYKSASKVYSEEDLRKAFQAGDTYRYHENGGFRSIPSDVLDEDEFIQSLKQFKTTKWFVAEVEDRETLARASGFSLKTDPVLKTTTINGKTYLVGTYEY
jgi:hypothetical protein